MKRVCMFFFWRGASSRQWRRRGGSGDSERGGCYVEWESLHGRSGCMLRGLRWAGGTRAGAANGRASERTSG